MIVIEFVFFKKELQIEIERERAMISLLDEVRIQTSLAIFHMFIL